MGVGQSILRSAKSAAKRARLAMRRAIVPAKGREDIHEYWRRPDDGANEPRSYLEKAERSRYLVGMLERYTDHDARVLEVGCNVGRNLAFLHDAGFKHLTGIEISQDAVDVMRAEFPEMAREASIICGAAEDVVRDFDDGALDVVFTMAVLEHVHTESEWIFGELTRITNDLLITIEDEAGLSWRHFPRDYGRIFERLGMRQVEEHTCDGSEGLSPSFKARVFRKR